MEIPIKLQEALRDSITSGTFIDTKFWVFSKRSSRAGRVGEPKALFANGHVVKGVPRLGAVLNRKETKEDLRTQFPADRKPYSGDYDYDADSDLEEDEDLNFSGDEDTQPVPVKGESDKSDSDSSTLTESQNLDAKGNESSDIISVSDVDSLFAGSVGTKAEVDGAVASTPTHIGAVVVVEDVAFVTLQALLRYLYTNEIEFAPWGSAEGRRARVHEEITEPYELPKPSPKSIYRLADKYDIPELKDLALQQIQRDLCKCDIVEEVFSKYTSRYPELRELELEQLARTLLSSDSSPVLDALKDKIKAYTQGQLPHAEDVLPALYEFMERNEPFNETPVQSPVPCKRGSAGVDWKRVKDALKRGTGCGDWKRLKDALTWSLTSGSFLDSQFYALDSKPPAGVPKIRPIYFCSMVGGSFSSKLVKQSSRIWPSSKTCSQCVDDYDSDIDDEGSAMGIPTDAYPRSACIPEDPLSTYKAPGPALVLKSGTAKTWGAIFFYMYTSQITFAPVRSQGITEMTTNEDKTSNGSSPVSNSPQSSEAVSTSTSKTAVVEACSPKSAYALARKIGLTSLCDLAFDNIKSQLNEKNIVQELFSPFTAHHEPIRQMQHKLFHSKLKPSVKGSSLLETIRSSSSGESSHRAATMELIFERSIQERRERITAGAKELKARPPPETPPVTDTKPEAVKSTPVKSEEKQPAPPKPTNGSVQPLSHWFTNLQSLGETPHPTKPTTSHRRKMRQ